MVRAKFKCVSVSKFEHGYDIVTLQPVWAEDGPNKTWSQATPSGKLEMTITNPDAVDYFEPGAEYEMEFKRDEATPVKR